MRRFSIPVWVAVLAMGCALQKVDPALIARFRPAVVGCFWPIFFFADHSRKTALRCEIPSILRGFQGRLSC